MARKRNGPTVNSGSNGHSNGQQPTINAEMAKRLEGLAANVLMSRAQLFKQFSDPRRSIEDECGYPSLNDPISPHLYQQLFEREAVAAKVVVLYPNETWQVTPTIFEDEDNTTATEFEKAWDGLGQFLRGEESYYQDEMGSPVWEYLKRADALSGIGQFGVMLFGIDDRLPLHMPANGIDTHDMPGFMGTDTQYIQPANLPAVTPAYVSQLQSDTTSPRKLLYLRCFPESQVQIASYETNIYSPRFQHPVIYHITLVGPRQTSSGIGITTNVIQVHWTRVLHVADVNYMPTSSEIFAVPKMRPVLDRILDLRKLYAGSAEMYWRGAFPGLQFKTHPQLGSDSDVVVDLNAMQDAAESYMNTLQRYLLAVGGEWESLAPQVVDPSPQIDKHLEAIAMALDCPKRQLLGSEVGQLASEQDRNKWDRRIMGRQQRYTTPRQIIPFVDRLVYLRVLPKPKKKNNPTFNRCYTRTRTIEIRDRGTGRLIRNQTADVQGVQTKGGYSLEWPPISSATATETAQIALTKARTITTFIQGNGEAGMTMEDMYVEVMGYTEEKAKQLVENATQGIDDRLSDTLPEKQSLFDSGNGGDGSGGDGSNGGGSGNGNGGGNGGSGSGGSKDKAPFDKSKDSPSTNCAERDLHVTECVYNSDGVCINCGRMLNEALANCGGEGSNRPGPCPKGVVRETATQLGARAVTGVIDTVVKKVGIHPSTVHPADATSAAMTALVQSLSGESRAVSMVAASVIIGIAPHALVAAKKGLDWLMGRVEEEKVSKKNKHQRTREGHQRRKDSK